MDSSALLVGVDVVVAVIIVVGGGVGVVEGQAVSSLMSTRDFPNNSSVQMSGGRTT